MFNLKIDRSEILESPLVYSTLVRRDGSKVYEIHKNRINGKRGIVSTDELLQIKIQFEQQYKQEN